MSFPIIAERTNGRFVAALLGDRQIRVEGGSYAGVVAELTSVILQHVQQGTLLTVETENRGVVGLAGKYSDDPTLRDICEDIYRERNLERTE